MTNLFGETIQPKPLKKTRAEKWARIQRQIDICFEQVADDWKREVLRYAANVFLPGRKDAFICESLRLAYDDYTKGRGLPVTIKKTAFAGIMRELRKRGFVEKVKGDAGYRHNFVLATTYRSLI